MASGFIYSYKLFFMSLRYKKKKIVLRLDKENPVEKYVAANVLVGSIGYAKLCSEVNQRTGIHRSIVDVVLAGAQDTMIAYLEEGFSVKLGEFGSFRPAINAEGQDDEKEVTASSIIRRRIAFTPGSKFQSMLSNAGMELFSVNGAESGDENGNGGTVDPGEEETPDPSL